MRNDALLRGGLASLIIAFAGVITRVILLGLFDPVSVISLGDAGEYVRAAKELQMGVLPTVTRPIGYSIFLAATLQFGVATVLLIQCAISISVAVATYWLFSRTKRGFSLGLALAVMPFTAIFDLQIRAECLFINLLWLGFLCLRQRRLIPAGLLIGLSIVVRDTLILLPLLLMLLARRYRGMLLASTIASLIGILPLAVIKSEGPRFGHNLWMGTWERNAAWYEHGVQRPNFPPYAFKLPGEEVAVKQAWLKNDGVLVRWAKLRLSTDPFGTAKAWVIRYPHLWFGTRVDSVPTRFAAGSAPWWVLKSSFFALSALILLAGLLGLYLLPDFFGLPIIYIALIYLPFHNSETRYSLPAVPFLLYFAAKIAVMRTARLDVRNFRSSDERQSERADGSPNDGPDRSPRAG